MSGRILFRAKLVDNAVTKSGAFTLGREYEVVDFNDYFGTYTILDDNGDRRAICWLRFEDGGRAGSEYQRAREVHQ